MTKVVIDPITRIEGHLRITCRGRERQGQGRMEHVRRCSAASRSSCAIGTRDDCWHFAQRICGVCPNPHALNSAIACERAMGVEQVPDNARLVRNMLDATQLGYDSHPVVLHPQRVRLRQRAQRAQREDHDAAS